MEFEFDSELKYHKSSYFSLANPTILKPVVESISQTSIVEAPKRKPTAEFTILSRTSSAKVHKMPAENQTKFLLVVLENGCFELNWKATAPDLGTNNRHNV